MSGRCSDLPLATCALTRQGRRPVVANSANQALGGRPDPIVLAAYEASPNLAGQQLYENRLLFDPGTIESMDALHRSIATGRTS